MDPYELSLILKNHRKWLNNEPGGVRANLVRADLEGANLSEANLTGAYLTEARLLRANLERADLEGANLEGANLSDAVLSFANLRGANLEGAYLWGANLRGAKLPDYLIVPKEGSFIGYKKVRGNVILKLEILGNRMNSLVGRKCRTDKARVLEALGSNEPVILRPAVSDGTELKALNSDEKEFYSMHDRTFIYRVGEIVEAPLNDDIRIECTNGIHFFMTEEEARIYY